MSNNRFRARRHLARAQARRTLPREGMSRRNLMRALGLAGSAAFLPSLAPRTGRTAMGAPKRLLMIVTSHGTVYDNWKMRPQGQDEVSDWEFDLTGLAPEEFSTILAPFHAVRDRTLILDGLAACPIGVAGINEHEAGHVAALTGTIGQEVENALAVATGPSIDQIISQGIATAGQYPSLEYSVGGWPVSFDNLGQPIPYEVDVFEAYNRLFPGGADPEAIPTEADRIRAAQPSVLDLVGDQYDAMVPKLSGEDRIKLEQHRDLIRALELQLDGLAAIECDAPEPPSGLPDWATAEYPLEMIQAYLNIAKIALSCNLAPVITLRADTMFNATLGAPAGDIHNDFAHGVEDSDEAKQVMTAYHRFHAAWIAQLIDELAATPDLDGSLLDDTVVVWANELSSGSHDFKRWPVVIAGGDSHFSLGRWVRWAPTDVLAGAWSSHDIGPAHNKLLVSLAQAYGLNIDSVGATSMPAAGGGSIDCTGALDRLTS
ncbi:DUF1552 domain-containing protein [Pseudenhygromyxa sp. WMMC2535]|uniref:DUF1552 domain-containing protein n=1 Tax=Pseudenhygromyxa sp. WMMC2535 TaxID=2712867 RepID=UPI001554E32D|nr:DUF1552 domain-containing protein [Pseudenhygromyxa sp. WMMC2535]NVB39504.1 DUF1552 domain-containing protein [Pseudenhygromyxa sp. WMMC2535]